MQDASPQAVVEVPAAAPETKAWNPLQVSGPMLGLTWLSFLFAAAILYKVAWKPILTILDRREDRIQRSLDQADQMRREAERADEVIRQRMDDAAEQARAHLEEARQQAKAAAVALEQEALKRAEALKVEAQREIAVAREEAVTELRRESARLAIDLAGQLVQRNLDDEDNRKLADDLLREI